LASLVCRAWHISRELKSTPDKEIPQPEELENRLDLPKYKG